MEARNCGYIKTTEAIKDFDSLPLIQALHKKEELSMKTILEELPKMLGTKFGNDDVIYKDGRTFSIPQMTMLTCEGTRVTFSGCPDILIIQRKWDN